MSLSVPAISGGYQAGAPSTTATSSQDTDTSEYWTLARCKKAYLDYLSSKRNEINEQQDSRRYRHGSHWTAKQIKAMNDRHQPAVTYNRIGRKIDGIVGLVEKMRQDPKAYPRTPEHEEGAELATAVIRYAMDQQEWPAKSPIVAADGAVDGIGGVELELTKGDRGDHEVGFETVDVDGFFYDPRSFRLDFSDARFMGVGKWLDADAAKELIPNKDAEIDASTETGSELTSNSDREVQWSTQVGEAKRIRLVDIWYKHKGEWCWAIFTGHSKLMEGQSYFKDEKNKTICKFLMYSACVDHDGDRYGFVRNLKSANDEINQRRSKGLHELNTRRIIAQEGHFTDIEVARREAAKPDGVVIYNPVGNDKPEFDDAKKQADITGQLKFLEDAKAEIENFGPNPALIGTGVNAKSGRAIALMQQAGIAELGPYILAYRGWKLRVYRAVFNAIRTHWTAERWIRVTDDEGIAQFVKINGEQRDPMTGQLALVNAIGSLDVDIVLDEGPDTVTMMEDMYETLSNVVPSLAPLLSPPEARAVVKMLIDTSPLAAAQKKAFREATQKAEQMPPPPDPQAEAIKLQAQIDMQSAEHTAQLDQAKTAAGIQAQREAAAVDLEATQQKMQADIEAMRIKNAATIELERMKAEIAASLQVKTAQLSLDLKDRESQMRCDEMDKKGEHERVGEERKAKQDTAQHEMKMASETNKSEAAGAGPKVVRALEKIDERIADIEKTDTAPIELVFSDGKVVKVKRGDVVIPVRRTNA